MLNMLVATTTGEQIIPDCPNAHVHEDDPKFLSLGIHFEGNTNIE
jgi:hypothetical protein